jgi:hypothetical protein
VDVDLAGDQAAPIEYAADENAAYVKLGRRNTTCLKSHKIETAHP